MHTRNEPTGDQHTPGRYEIRLRGQLDERWSTWFDGLSLGYETDGITVLSGPIIDQAALHGVLRKIRDLGLPLISINLVQSNQSDVPTGDEG